MIGLREVAIFLAGAQAFHTLSHAILPVMVQMPMQLKWPHMVFTMRWNTLAVGFNALVTVLLFLWAASL